MSSSSGDDVAIEEIAARAKGADSPEGSASPVPDWISQYHSPSAARAGSVARHHSSSDSDLEILSRKPGPSSPVVAGKPPASQSSVLEALTSNTVAKAREKAPAKTASKAPAGKTSPAKGRKDGKHKAALVPTVAATLHKVGIQPASHPVLEPEAADAANAGEVPLVLPEKLPTNKYFVELEPVGDGADDLTGDAGAVGRMLVSGEGEEAELCLDLKGVIYDAALVPCACSLAVVNIGNTEAKVEAISSSFLQLTRQAGENNGSGHDDNHFLWDDDDNYQVADGGGEDGPKKAGSKRKAPGDADAPTKKRKQTAKSGKAPTRKKPVKAGNAKRKKKK